MAHVPGLERAHNRLSLQSSDCLCSQFLGRFAFHFNGHLLGEQPPPPDDAMIAFHPQFNRFGVNAGKICSDRQGIACNVSLDSWN